MFKKILYLCLFFLYITTNAQILINEFSASNLHSFTDEFGKTEDWIELHNASNQDIDLGGWFLSDKENNPAKFPIPEGTIIPAFDYMVFLCSGRNLVGEENIHTNFKLSQTTGKDIIMLSNIDTVMVEKVDLNITQVEHSWAKTDIVNNDWMVCTEPTPNESNDGAPVFKGYAATPTMSVTAGFYQDSISVEIMNQEPNSALRFTTDGTNPTEDSPEYQTPIKITETTVLKAKVFSKVDNILPSKIEFNTYFINEDDFTLAVFSVAADDVIELANGDGDLIPIGSIEYFNTEKKREATSFGDLNRHGQDSWVLDHRSIDWVSRDEMGYSKGVLAPIFSYSNRDDYQRFMFRNSGDDNYPAIEDAEHEGSTHIRDEYVHQLAHDGNMELDLRAVERVILFLNGQYWGLYGMRERPVDHDYTKEYYDQDKYHIQYLTTWGDTEAEYGGDQAFFDWEELRNFILENDMSDAENYEHVTDQYNVLSLIDYMLVNLNTVAMDWLNYNTGWWRGLDPEGDHKKWGYIIWDLDATFDYYINYTNVPNTDPDAQPCDLDDISEYMDEFFGPLSDITNSVAPDNSDCPSIINGSCPYPPDDPLLEILFNANNQFLDGSICCENWENDCNQWYNWAANGWLGGDQGNVGAHEKIFDKLLTESPEFAKLYYERYADLMNTVYSCENMNETLDRMLAVIDPEMDRQIDRWGGTREEWEANVQSLKDFINARCTLLDDGAIACYDELSGPFEITLVTEPDGVGEIDFNTLDIREFPWTGAYFGGTENRIKSRVFDEWLETYEFSHWERATGGAIFPDSSAYLANIELTENDTLTAIFKEKNVTSIQQLSQKINLQLYPNPAQNFIQLTYFLEKSKNVSIELQDILGKKVMDFTELNGKKTTGKQQHILQLDQSLPNGSYLLRVRVGEEIFTQKVSIIQN